jgi:hypothetical protein
LGLDKVLAFLALPVQKYKYWHRGGFGPR